MIEQDLKNSNKVVGLKQSKKALVDRVAKIVFIAKDADKRIKDEIITLCNENRVQMIYVDTMKQLGHECGIDVGAAVACIF